MEKEVLITEIFDAPRELVFRAWTDAEWLPQWYAPNNCTIRFKKLNITVGGSFHSCIHNPEYGDCWVIGEYKEIITPERLVYTAIIADEEGIPADPALIGMHPDWPAETIITVTFKEENGKTIVTLHQNASESVAKTTGAHPSWLQQLNNLKTFIADK